MKNLLDQVDTWKKLISLLAIVGSVAFSVGVYAENWFKIGLNLKMPFIKNENIDSPLYIQRFSLNNGFVAFPIIDRIEQTKISLKIYYYTAHPGWAYVNYNLGYGQQSTQHVEIEKGTQVVSGIVFDTLKCNTTYSFAPGFSNEGVSLFGNVFYVETAPCLSQ